ncbi:MAG: hypothetical protein Q4D76_11530 [Oscillospiraceae bacterium]|nr:hypothetical protein [Oscillospiraceae bacterium]
MEKFIPFEKLSKKKQREINNLKRSDWGSLNPVTRKTENKKAYNRKKRHRPSEYENDGAFNILQLPFVQ